MKKITKDQLHQIEIAGERENKKAQGFFDGRFRTRSVKSKKTYSRKCKHKNVGHE